MYFNIMQADIGSSNIIVISLVLHICATIIGWHNTKHVVSFTNEQHVKPQRIQYIKLTSSIGKPPMFLYSFKITSLIPCLSILHVHPKTLSGKGG